jgi:hypothetical protein
MSNDYSVIVCKVCNKEHKRYFAGRYPNGKDKRWIDEHGREFSGKVCAGCHANRCAKRIAIKRQSSKKKSLFVG